MYIERQDIMETIKKYRRRVTDEQVEVAAIAVFGQWWRNVSDDKPVYAYEEWGDKDYFRRCARAAIEAAAEVITPEFITERTAYYEVPHPIYGKSSPMGFTLSIEVFNAVWEEII
jgi:hypothetical protein